MSYKILIFLTILVSLNIGCKSDPQTQTNVNHIEEIQGKWIVTEAARNKRLTKTLNDAYFDFSNTTLKSDVMGDEADYKYSIVGDKLTLSGGYMELVGDSTLEYQIARLTSDTLVLTTRIRNFDFILFAIKDSVLQARSQ